MDVEPSLLAVAKARLPGVPLHLGDMRTFNLGRQFDVVTCLFSSIGYMLAPEDQLQAIANMAGHLAPDRRDAGRAVAFARTSSTRTTCRGRWWPRRDGMSIVRMNDSRVEGRLSIMRFHYLVGRPGKIDHFVEEHIAGPLHGRRVPRHVRRAPALDAELDEEGLMGRGLWIARHARSAAAA